MTKFVLVSSDLSYYIDPFTNERAIFDTENAAHMTSMMLFDQQERKFKVEEIK